MKNKFWKNGLSALIVAILGFVLLNATFMADWAWQSLIKFIFLPNLELTDNWIPAVMQASFVIIIALISWLVYRSKIGTIFKAAFTTVPVAIVLVFDGILFFRTPALAYSIGAVIMLGVLALFYYKKFPWLYYYSVLLVALGLLVLGLTGTDI